MNHDFLEGLFYGCFQNLLEYSKGKINISENENYFRNIWQRLHSGYYINDTQELFYGVLEYAHKSYPNKPGFIAIRKIINPEKKSAQNMSKKMGDSNQDAVYIVCKEYIDSTKTNFLFDENIISLTYFNDVKINYILLKTFLFNFFSNKYLNEVDKNIAEKKIRGLEERDSFFFSKNKDKIYVGGSLFKKAMVYQNKKNLTWQEKKKIKKYYKNRKTAVDK